MPDTAMEISEIRRGEIAPGGQHRRGPNGGYSAPTDLPQLIETAMATSGDCVEVILDADFELPEPTAESDPEPVRTGVLELRIFQRDDDGDELPPVRVRLPAELLPALSRAIAQAKSLAAARFGFIDALHALR